ncbi:MAG: thioredoxin [Candidatus Komeilibacteria bacterium RIFCSPLOWO2_01_FULL_52_15]|uniref:Thioredoxin n=2 Tax=Candidatus Komeiliibacteriota TaxID=1817908 RepID=A0A1G2BQE6_9BACT|nr:MAG: thioredoxin [Candidatus Komeilibacteria bacterium RIFCSPHIGHO2_01_FULL_52_14]OGY91046.1 MAG: thioredoxin [Candidatus Komeilibacteria bacterium RIFCSPLOWO2_01_FULL_52_15]
MENIVTDANFKKEVEEAGEVVMIDFWAPWCGPCRVQGPIVEDIAKQFASKHTVKVGKMNVDENPQTAQTYQIFSIPTLKIFKAGKVVENLIGLQSRETLVKLLEKHSAA